MNGRSRCEPSSELLATNVCNEEGIVISTVSRPIHNFFGARGSMAAIRQAFRLSTGPVWAQRCHQRLAVIPTPDLIQYSTSSLRSVVRERGRQVTTKWSPPLCALMSQRLTIGSVNSKLTSFWAKPQWSNIRRGKERGPKLGQIWASFGPKSKTPT